jgi:hypothetical protein
MINKSSLQSIISKYYLGGINESTKWEIKNGILTIKFMSPSQDMLGKITYTDFPLEDIILVIFNTSQLNKLISVTSGGLILSVVKTNKIATRLEVADAQFNVTYALADTMMVNKVADVEEPSSYGVEINLDQENIMALISKLKSAIANDSYDEIKSVSKNLQDSLMEVGKKVYSNTPSTSSEPKGSADSVIDADFSETK